MKKGLAQVRATMDGLKIQPCRFESVKCHRCPRRSEPRVQEDRGVNFKGFIEIEEGLVLCEDCKEQLDELLVVFWLNQPFRLRVTGREDVTYDP